MSHLRNNFSEFKPPQVLLHHKTIVLHQIHIHLLHHVLRHGLLQKALMILHLHLQLYCNSTLYAIFSTTRLLFSSFSMLLFWFSSFLQQRLFFLFADFCSCTERLAAIFYDLNPISGLDMTKSKGIGLPR